MSEVIVVIGAGQIGQAIARRVSAGKHVVVADLHDQNAEAAAGVMRDAGFEVSTATVNVSSGESVHALVETATGLGGVTGVIHAAGSLTQPGLTGDRLGALTEDQNAALATTPADELLKLPMLQPDQVTDPLHAYQLAKRGNSLRVMAEAVRWGKRGARLNTISPGIIFTPLARDELTGPRGRDTAA